MRRLEIPIFGNTSDLEAALARSGIVAEDTSKKIQGSFRTAGLAAAKEAEAIGASVDEQAAAAGRAAAAFTEMSARITTAQRAAGKAAAAAAGEVGASVDEQRAAYMRAIATQADFEAAQERAAAAAKKASADQVAAANANATAVKRAASDHAAAVEAGHKSIASVGKWALMGGVGAAAFSVDQATKLQSQMEQLHTQAGASQAEVGKMTKSVLALAGPLGTSPQALAASLYDVESAGIHGGKALKIMSTAAKAAQMSGADLEDTTTALTATVFSGIKGAQNFSQAMGTLNATVGAGTMHFQDLNEAFAGPMLATVKGYGLSLTDIGAALATFGDLNIKGADAATQLRMAVQYMAKPAATAGPLLKELGLNTHSFADEMAHGGLLPALKLLHDRLQMHGIKSNQYGEIISQLFSKKGASGITILENSLDKLQGKYTQVKAGAHHFNADYAATTKTFAFQSKQLKQTGEALADVFGLMLLPGIEKVTHGLMEGVTWLEHHKDAAKAAGIVLSTVLGAAIAVYAEQKAVKFANATKSMISDLTALGRWLGYLPAKFDEAGGAAEGMGAKTAAAGAESETAGGQMAGSGAAAATAAPQVSALASAETAAGSDAAAAQPELEGFAGAVTAEGGAAATAAGEVGSLATAEESAAAGAGALGLGGMVGMGLPVVGGAILAGKMLQPILTPDHNPQHLSFGQLESIKRTQQGKYDQTGFAAALLHQLNAPITQQNLKAIVGWETQEGGNWQNTAKFNPLNTTLGEPGATAINRANVMAYKSWAQGISATAKTLQSSRYAPILAALRAGNNSAAVAHAIANSQWGTQPAVVRAIANTPVPHDHHHGGASNTAADNLLNSVSKAHAKKVAAALGVPAGVTTMLATAKALVGTRYTYGGGHGGWDPIDALKKIGIDCTGFVSQVLHSGGVLSTPQDTTSLPGAAGIARGQGRFVTVWDRPKPGEQGHALIDIMGHWFESGGSKQFNPAGGVAELSSKQAAGELALGGFEAFHPSALNSLVRGGKSAAGSALGGASLLANYVQQQDKQLGSRGGSLLQRLQDTIQSGTLRTLENATGVSTGGRAGAVARFLAAHQQGAPSAHELSRYYVPALAGASAGSQQTRQLDQLVTALRATHSAALAKLAGELVQAHKQALADLGRELYAEQAKKDAESLTLQATQITDQSKLASDMAATQVQIAKDQAQQVKDAMDAASTQMQDSMRSMQDRFSAIAQAISDQAQAAASASQAVVTGIQDQTSIRVDILGERGLFGLNLIAQQEQVQLDIMKAGFDQQIAAAQANVDATKAVWDANVAQAQQAVDQTQTQQDQLVAMAQQRADTVQIAQDQRIASAQAHVDAITLDQDMTVQLAQNFADLAAEAPKAVQDATQAQLTRAQASQKAVLAPANAALAAVQSSANAAEEQAQAAYTQAQEQATAMIDSAQAALTQAQGQASVANANAQATLQGVQNAAAQAEAAQQGQIDVTKAQASTQFAGTGLTVNMYGIPMDNAAAIGQEMDWFARSHLAALAA